MYRCLFSCKVFPISKYTLIYYIGCFVTPSAILSCSLFKLDNLSNNRYSIFLFKVSMQLSKIWENFPSLTKTFPLKSSKSKTTMKCMRTAIYYETKLEFLFPFTKGKDSFVWWLAAYGQTILPCMSFYIIRYSVHLFYHKHNVMRWRQVVVIHFKYIAIKHIDTVVYLDSFLVVFGFEPFFCGIIIRKNILLHLPRYYT